MPTKIVNVENIIIDGENKNDGNMEACEKGEKGFRAPFALFSPDLQANVGGPYAKREHAQAALNTMLKGQMVPYTNEVNLVWNVKRKPSKWYQEK